MSSKSFRISRNRVILSPSLFSEAKRLPGNVLSAAEAFDDVIIDPILAFACNFRLEVEEIDGHFQRRMKLRSGPHRHTKPEVFPSKSPKGKLQYKRQASAQEAGFSTRGRPQAGISKAFNTQL